MVGLNYILNGVLDGAAQNVLVQFFKAVCQRNAAVLFRGGGGEVRKQ